MSPLLAASVDSFLAGRLAVTLPELARAIGRTLQYVHLEKSRGRIQTIGRFQQRLVPAAAVRAYMELLEREGATQNKRGVGKCSKP